MGAKYGQARIRFSCQGIAPFEQFIGCRQADDGEDREQVEQPAGVHQLAALDYLGQRIGVEPHREVRHPVEVVALKPKRLGDEVEGHTRECVVAADRVQGHQKEHHPVAQLAEAVDSLHPGDDAHKQHDGQVLCPPDRAVVGVQCTQREEGEVGPEEEGLCAGEAHGDRDRRTLHLFCLDQVDLECSCKLLRRAVTRVGPDAISQHEGLVLLEGESAALGVASFKCPPAKWVGRQEAIVPGVPPGWVPEVVGVFEDGDPHLLLIDRATVVNPGRAFAPGLRVLIAGCVQYGARGNLTLEPQGRVQAHGECAFLGVPEHDLVLQGCQLELRVDPALIVLRAEQQRASLMQELLPLGSLPRIGVAGAKALAPRQQLVQATGVFDHSTVLGLRMPKIYAVHVPVGEPHRCVVRVVVRFSLTLFLGPGTRDGNAARGVEWIEERSGLGGEVHHRELLIGEAEGDCLLGLLVPDALACRGTDSIVSRGGSWRCPAQWLVRTAREKGGQNAKGERGQGAGGWCTHGRGEGT